MKRLHRFTTHLHPIAASALVLLLAACTLEISQISATEAVAVTAAAGLDPTLTATFAEPTPSATVGLWPVEPLPTVTPTTAPAPAGGEWLLVETKQGLWMGRPDGSQAGIRIPGPISVPVPLSDAFSPDGRLFVYQTSIVNQNGCIDPILNIVSLTGTEPAVVIPLTSSQSACPRTLPVDLDDVDQALTGHNPFAWSPDGGRLAFIGAQDGPSADLYEYFRVNGQVTRLTDGPDQAYRPLWSPDGQWIVHGAVSGFGSGAGYGVTGFYAARADGGDVLSLYPIGERSADEVGVGWLDARTLVARTRSPFCESEKLRLVDLSALRADVIFEGCTSDVAVGKNAVLFAQSEWPDSSDAELPPGRVYRLTASDRTPRLIGNQNIYRIAWVDGIGAFLAVTRDFRVLEISTAGDFRTLPVTVSDIPTVSPGGHWWAYMQLTEKRLSDTDGIFVAEYGKGFRQIFEGTTTYNGVLFSPDGNSLYFVTVTGYLYRAQAPAFSPVLLASGLTSDYGSIDMAWWEG